ncbi:unnamed protein product [Heligmosomoides polygyrus]|uniref:Arylamine N-acetyltransferase n=1 Tax=Heligmosomoides polygyrus TaxID=6339 RepID=A0A183FAT0_HELPZ|nr:unnamed protein product [Heligmosomoides polygyrus]
MVLCYVTDASRNLGPTMLLGNVLNSKVVFVAQLFSGLPNPVFFCQTRLHPSKSAAKTSEWPQPRRFRSPQMGLSWRSSVFSGVQVLAHQDNQADGLTTRSVPFQIDLSHAEVTDEQKARLQTFL